MAYILLLGSIIFISPVTKRQEINNIITLSFFFLLFFACTRFGVGTDYFNYYPIFSVITKNISVLSIASNYLIYGVEPGFSFLIALFKYFNLSYVYFIAFCAFIPLAIIFHTIQKYSSNKIVSLFLFFSCYYLVYIESAIRQGIAMSIFIYAFYYYISTKKIKYYLLLIFIGMAFHISIAATLIIPIILKIERKYFFSPIVIISLVIISLIFSLIFIRYFVSVIPILRGKLDFYLKEFSFNLFAIFLRLLKLLLIYLLYIRLKKKITPIEMAALKVYIFGFILYFFFSSISIFSRMTNYFMFSEIILLPNMLKYLYKNEKKIVIYVYVMLFSFMFLKDIDSFLYQREYYSKNIFDYKHITIFNKNEIINEIPKNVSQKYFNENK